MRFQHGRAAGDRECTTQLAMIVDEGDFGRAKELFQEAREQCGVKAVQFGFLFQTIGAVDKARELFAEAREKGSADAAIQLGLSDRRECGRGKATVHGGC